MSGGASIVVTFQTIEEAKQNTVSTTSYLNQELEQLKRDLQPLRSIWAGAAAGGYGDVQDQWNKASAGLNQILADIGEELRKAHDLYTQIEQQNRQSWQ
jgi:WXG100 family type VII secretion target